MNLVSTGRSGVAEQQHARVTFGLRLPQQAVDGFAPATAVADTDVTVRIHETRCDPTRFDDRLRTGHRVEGNQPVDDPQFDRLGIGQTDTPQMKRSHRLLLGQLELGEIDASSPGGN